MQSIAEKQSRITNDTNLFLENINSKSIAWHPIQIFFSFLERARLEAFTKLLDSLSTKGHRMKQELLLLIEKVLFSFIYVLFNLIPHRTKRERWPSSIPRSIFSMVVLIYCIGTV